MQTFLFRLLAAALAALSAMSTGSAQQFAPFLARLPLERLDVAPPESRVRGAPGRFALDPATCPATPATNVRRRIIDTVVQEWAYFGFAVSDETDPATWARRGPPRRDGAAEVSIFDPAVRERLLGQAEAAARVAPSIAGYWAVTADGAWIVDRYNEAWRASGGLVTRWRDPWSAAFISWVMCEAGFASPAQFQRAVAHHVYIDQAIRARDGEAPDAVFVAHEVGEQPIVPGDMVCLARRPAYRTLADRRSQFGAGARTHCDFVVKVDEDRQWVLAIGGNVRGTVGLKVLPAERNGSGWLRPVDRSVVPGAATTFVHMKLRAPPIEADAFDASATLAALACTSAAEPPAVMTVGLVSKPQPTEC